VSPQTVGPVNAQAGRRSTHTLRRRGWVLATALAVLALGLVVLTPGPAAAATFTVTKTADTNDGVCDADCSLREAVQVARDAQQACALPPAPCDETVVVPAGTYLEPLGVLEITSIGSASGPVSVVGAGPGQTIIDAQLAHRDIEIPIGSVVKLRGMTIRNGRFGGNDVATHCSAIGGGPDHTHGGAVHSHGVLTIENVTITGSSAPDDGGGLASGTCGSTFNNPHPCPVGHGACATLTNVTITGNQAPGRGGGIVSSQALYLTNVTIANNTAHEGSGIYAAAPPPPSVDPACTPGVCARPMTLLNTIVSARGSASTACAGTAPLTSLGHNLFTDGSCPSIASDRVGVDPRLSGLQPDGTLALLPGSPAIDAGTNNGCPATDERGTSRPQNGVCDIGAYEAAAKRDDDDDDDDDDGHGGGDHRDNARPF
jgi:CSLREA domain-containing protein